MIPIGARVELLPHLDLWARGARFGTLVKYKAKGGYRARNGQAVLTPIAVVRLDIRPKRLAAIWADDLKEVE